MPVEGPSAFIELDGSYAEGGGQVLRTALSLSLITGQAFGLRRFRSQREQPGLRPAHLACIRGAAAISDSATEGAVLGSKELVFRPAPVRPGDYLLELGTTGSATLLLQCLFFPLALAGGGEVTLRGPTHVPKSPPSQYLSWPWLAALAAYGFRAELHLRHAGFAPEGAGELVARISECSEPPTAVDLSARGMLRDVHVASFVCGLPFSVAEQQGQAAVQRLREHGILAALEKRVLPATRSPGTLIFIRAEFERSIAAFTALGERGQDAWDVGRQGASKLLAFLESPGSIDEHLADQLLLPAALLASGILGESPEGGTTRFLTARITGHLAAQAAVIEKFLPVGIAISAGGDVLVSKRT